MIESVSSDRIASLLTFFLDVQSRRAQVVSSNVANVDTPGYRAKELDFSEQLHRAASDAVTPGAANALLKANADGLGVVEQLGNATGIDGNTVDMEHEMATLAQAGGQYMSGLQLLQSRLRTLRIAIREGR